MKIKLRELKSDDVEWVVTSHGDFYSKVYGWNKDFENLVADIMFDYFKKHDPVREHAWIAELDGERVGSIMLTQSSQAEAKLRVLYVDSKARGHGVGALLVKECLDFAKKCRYERITLWTNKQLESARKIYEANGFTLEKEEESFSYGVNFVGQYWTKSLK